MKPLSVLLLLASFAAIGQAQVIPDCGGEDQRACHPFDNEFWQTDSLACEYDLKLKTRLFHEDTCVDWHRRTLDKNYSWVGWALSEQRYNIGAALPINFGTHLGTHNSYSNYQQGFVDIISVNQWYSITDQLQGGARTIRLDPVWYYNALRLCHGDTTTQCQLTSPGRYFASAVKEVGAWLDANPGEVIILRIHDDDLSDHKDYFNKPIEEFLGSKVFTKTIRNLGYQGRWPTMSEMRTSGHQVIIFNGHDYGKGWSFNYSDYFLEANRNSDRFAGCSNLNTSDVATRGVEEWALISEGRTMSDSADPALHLVFKNNVPGLLYEPEVATAARCSFSNIEVDFFLRLDKGYRDATSNYSRSGDDLRREATIWSWQQDDYGKRGPALLDGASGRWRSLAAANNYPYLCMKPDPDGNPAKADWRISGIAGAWNYDNGNRICAAQFGPGFSFSYPRNALQNQKVRNVYSGDIWLGYSTIPIPEPSAGPPVIRFQMQRGGATPAPVSVQVVGTVGDPPNTFSAQFSTGGQHFSMSIPSNIIQFKGTPLIVAVNSGASALDVGVYQAVIRLSQTGSTHPGGTISVALEVLEPTATSLTASASSPYELTKVVLTATVNGHPLPRFQDSITGTVVLRDTFIDPLTFRTSVKDLDRAFLSSPDINSSGPSNQVKFAVTLQPGVHTLIAKYLGDSHYSPSESVVLTVTVKPLVTVQPSSITFSVTRSAPMAGPWQINAFNADPVQPASGFFTIPAASSTNAGRIPIYATVSPSGLSSRSATVTLDPEAATSLSPGQYDLDIRFTRGDKVPAPQVTRLSMKVMGTLSAVASQVNLTGEVLSKSLSINGSGPMPVTVTVNQAPWLTAKLASNMTPTAVLFTANTGVLTPGDYVANVVISSPVSENSIPVTVKLHLLGATTISTNVPNGSLIVDKQSFSSPAVFYWEPGSHHNVGAALLTQQDTARWRFQRWSDGLAATHVVIMPNVITAGLTLNATYTAEFKLSTGVTPSMGGAITPNPLSADGFYADGTPVSVSATSAAGYVFVGFTGALTGTATPSVLTMNAPQSLGAVFSAAPPTFTDVQIGTSPAGLMVKVDGLLRPAGSTLRWQVGSHHTVEAAVVQGEQNGARFALSQWSDGGLAIHTITPTDTKPIAITAFYRRQYQLVVTSQPQSGGAASGAGWYDDRFSVTVGGTPAKGFTFTGFSGALKGSANPQTLVVTGPLQVQATFAAMPPTIFAAPGVRADAPGGSRSVSITLTNSGGPADVQIDSITPITVVSGTGDVRVASAFPAVAGSIPAGETRTLVTLWSWPDTARRVQFTVNFSAFAGAYRGSTVLTVFR